MVAIATALIPCELPRFETCETIGFDSRKTVVNPTMAGVCAPVEIGGTKMIAEYDYLAVEGVFPLCPIVAHFSFCFYSSSMVGASLGGF